MNDKEQTVMSHMRDLYDNLSSYEEKIRKMSSSKMEYLKIC